MDLAGHNELAELGRSFNQMIGQLDRSLAEIKEREGFLQSLIDAIPDGVRVIDKNYRVVKANKAFCEQQGFKLNDIVGKSCYETSHARYSPCSPTLVTCPIHELGGGTSTLVCRHRHVRADGQEFYVEVSAATLSAAAGGERHGFVVEAIRDLSKEMRLSQEQRLSEIAMLAVGVAHAIRNPLASIHYSLHGLCDALLPLNQPTVSSHLKIIEDEINSCVSVTDRLLRLSEPPCDVLELVSFNDVVPGVMSLRSAHEST